jgi:FAD/FMN-containing dehydrogenase
LVRKLGTPITFDISLDIPKMNDYVQEVRRQLTAAWPQSRMVTFGHLGDGNIHIVVSVGSLDEDDVHAVESIIYEALGRRDGVISAEHGIGLDKRQYLPLSRSKEEIALMKTLKRAMDPKGILNPGKIFL